MLKIFYIVKRMGCFIYDCEGKIQQLHLVLENVIIKWSFSNFMESAVI